jgi:DNA-binding response OmpR family regulator
MILQRGPPLKILILEDEALVALEEEDLVRSMGYEVVGPVARLDVGMRIIESERIDGALLDVNLSGEETSFPLARELQRQIIPFLFVTGLTKAFVTNAFPGVPVVHKPFQPAVLTFAIKRLIAR